MEDLGKVRSYVIVLMGKMVGFVWVVLEVCFFVMGDNVGWKYFIII